MTVIYNQGSEVEDFDPILSAGSWNYQTLLGGSPNFNYRSGYARAGLWASAGLSTSHLWLGAGSSHTTMGAAFMQGGGQPWAFAAAGPFFGLGVDGNIKLGVAVSAGNVVLVKWDGAAWVTLATGPALGTGLARWDMLVENYGATARCRVWLWFVVGGSRANVIDFTGDVTSPTVTNVNGCWVRTLRPLNGIDSESNISEVIVADSATTRLSLVTRYLTGAGDVNTMDSGTYANIVGAPAPSGTSFCESGTAGQELLGTCSAFPAGSFLIVNTKLVLLASKGATGPTKIQPQLKTASDNALGAAQALDVAYAAYPASTANDPATGVAMTQAAATTMQIGFKSVA